MSREIDAPLITTIVCELVGDIIPHGDGYDHERLRNQEILCMVIDELVDDIRRNTKYANDESPSKRTFGHQAGEFLCNLVEYYNLKEFVKQYGTENEEENKCDL